MKDKKHTQFFSVAWVPDFSVPDYPVPTNEKEVIACGGRIVDKDFTKLAADEFVQCLNDGTEGLEGAYILIL